MKKTHIVSIACLTVLALGCSSGISINHDYDTEANFASYRTFDWFPMELVDGAEEMAGQRNDLFENRVKSAVNEQLSKKGLRQDSNSPDLWVAWHTGIEDKIDVTDWGYTYADYYYRRGAVQRDVTVSEYQEGTLIVDLIEVQTKELVWRGSATKVVDPNPTPEKITKTLNDVIGKMFSKYPPK